MSIPVLKSAVRVQRKGKEHLLETFADLSELKRAEKSLRTSHRFLDIAHRADNIPQMVEEFLKEVKTLASCRVAVIQVREKDGRLVHQSADGLEYPVDGAAHWLLECIDHCTPFNSMERSVKDFHELIRGGTFLHNHASILRANYQCEGGKEPSRCHTKMPYESIALIPVRHEGLLLGCIYLVDQREGIFSKELVELLEGAAMQMSIAIQKIRALESLKQAQHDIEQRFQARTEELLAANRLLEAEVLEHRITEEKLREESAFRAGITANASVGINVWHPIEEFPYMRLTVWNKEMEEITGRSMDEINRIGWARAMYDDPKLQARAEATLKEAYEGEGHSKLERTFRRPDGEERTVLISSSVFSTHDNKKHVIAVMKDVTDLRKAEKSIRDSEAQFRDLVENISIGVLIAQDGMVVYQNPEQRHLLEYLPVSSKLQDIIELVHPDDQPVFRQFVESPQASNHEFSEVLLRFKSKPDEGSADLKWIVCRRNFIEYQGENAILITMTDITQRKELERLLMLREKLVSLGHVSAGIAHEIRNPLSGINVYLDAIYDHFQDPECAEDVRSLIKDAQKASYKIENVIKRVLDFSRPTELNLTPGCVNEAIHEAAKLAAASLRKSSITLELDLAEDLPQAFVDMQFIEQVVLNLITNAANALKTVQADRRIRISTSAENNNVFVRVDDSGPGIPYDLRDKVFEPFFSARNQGIGIGLGICQRIVTDHGGKIDVFTSSLGGAQFDVVIPIEKRRVNR